VGNDNGGGGGWKGEEGSVALGEKKKVAHGWVRWEAVAMRRASDASNAIRCWRNAKDFQV
jgi:hypothetical protein